MNTAENRGKEREAGRQEAKEGQVRRREFADGVCLSELGMGAMRLPQTEEGFAKPIDRAAAEELIDYCMAHGVNYYDTAYIYHGGQSEAFLGRALKKYPRESYFVADKFNVQAEPDFEKQFEDQLSRLQLDSIDFYLLHGMTDKLVSDYLDHGAPEYFLKQKKAGKIRYFGFSFHGSPEALRRILSRYPWDFVQIQLNYYDWFHGTAREQYEILREQNIPIMVMEPAHGGMLADLPGKGRETLLRLHPEASQASWAFRFLRTLPGIAVILSGMSKLEQVKDNIQTFSEPAALTEQELDIPFLLAAYNEYRTGGEKDLSSWRLARLAALPEERQPSACIGCGQCTAHCPQGLDVPAYMKEMAELM